MTLRLRAWMVLAAVLILALAIPVAADSGNVSLFGQDLTIRSGERIGGDASVFGGSAVIEEGATLAGDLAVIGGTARIAGTVQGDVAVLGGKLELESTARVSGDVVAMGELVRDPAAQIGGEVIAGAEVAGSAAGLGEALRGDMTVQPITVTSERSPVANALISVLKWLGWLVMLLIAGLLAVSIIPAPLDHISDVMSSSGPLSLGMGFLTLVAMAILTPLLIITVIGIPVVLVIGVALVLACLVGWLAAATVMGEKVVKATSGMNRAARAAIGIVLLALLGRIPCIGWLIGLLATMWGLGAVVLTRFGTSDERIWAPFAALAANTATPIIRPARPAAPTPPERPAAPAILPPAEPEDQEPAEGEAKDDTRRLDGSSLDDDMAQYTKD